MMRRRCCVLHRLLRLRRRKHRLRCCLRHRCVALCRPCPAEPSLANDVCKRFELHDACRLRWCHRRRRVDSAAGRPVLVLVLVLVLLMLRVLLLLMLLLLLSPRSCIPASAIPGGCCCRGGLLRGTGVHRRLPQARVAAAAAGRAAVGGCCHRQSHAVRAAPWPEEWEREQ